MQIATYKNGPNLYAHSITMDMIFMVINKLHLLFGEGYEFVLESIYEGGIEWVKWPGKQPGQYKTFRFTESNYWPAIPNIIDTEWFAEVSKQVVWTRGKFPQNKMRTCLKAFDGAPAWTKREIESFRDALETVGICRSATRLRQYRT